MSSSAAKDLAGDADTADAKIDYDAAKVEFLQVQISVFRDSPSYSALCVSRCTSWLPDAGCRVSGCVSVFSCQKRWLQRSDTVFELLPRVTEPSLDIVFSTDYNEAITLKRSRRHGHLKPTSSGLSS